MRSARVTHKELTTVGKAELCFAFLLEAAIHAHAGIAFCWTLRGPAPATLREGGPAGGDSEAVCLKIALDLFNGKGSASLPRVLQLILPDPRQGGALLHLMQALHEGHLAQVKYVNKVIAAHLKDVPDPAAWAKAVGLPVVEKKGVGHA